MKVDRPDFSLTDVPNQDPAAPVMLIEVVTGLSRRDMLGVGTAVLFGAVLNGACLRRKHINYTIYDVTTHREVTYTQPCGRPIPPGARCVCNCVAGPASSGTRTTTTTTTRSGTQPCGQPIPRGAICTCNCVPSSQRWKETIRPLNGALDLVERLRGVRYRWADDAPQGCSGPDLGLIAEEVAEVVPEVVAFDEQGNTQGVDYARLTPVLIEAIKTQQRQIAELQREVRELKGQLSHTGVLA